jgi:hypothetical protein
LLGVKNKGKGGGREGMPGKSVWLLKGNTKDPCDGDSLHLACGGGYTKLYKRQNYIELNTHTHSTNKTEEI